MVFFLRNTTIAYTEHEVNCGMYILFNLGVEFAF